MENLFIKTVKEENRHKQNLEELHDTHKLTDDCYQSVAETLEKRYRMEIYLALNCQDHDKRTKYVHWFVVNDPYKGKEYGRA